MEHTITEQIKYNPYHGTAALDPRCKLFLLICLGLTSYALTGEWSELALMTAFSLLISAGGGRRWAMEMILLYGAVAYFNTLLRYVSIPVLSVMMGVFGVTVLKMIPIFMMARWMLKTTHMDDLMVSLQRMKLPQSVTIPLTVMLRCIPTLAVEYKMIRNAMDMRGICGTPLKKLLHPIKTVEYILIPLLMRCLKVTDELAASGAVRGLEREEKRYAINEVRFSGKEYAVAAGAVLLLSGLAVMDRVCVGQLLVWRAPTI